VDTVDAVGGEEMLELGVMLDVVDSLYVEEVVDVTKVVVVLDALAAALDSLPSVDEFISADRIEVLDVLDVVDVVDDGVVDNAAVVDVLVEFGSTTMSLQFAR
jgi:hypothetical protein